MNATTSTTHDSDSDDELYEIETIVHARVKADNSGWEYLIKVRPGVDNYLNRLNDLLQFVGFGDEENIYIDDTQMSDAAPLLDSFWSDIGHDNKDYQPGEILAPSKEWQKRQRKEVRRRKEAK